MAKRKRLSEANPQFLDQLSGLETKTMFPSQSLPTAPIADVAADAASQAAIEEMADIMGRARAEGRMVMSVPLDQIEMNHLVRDRMRVEDDDMAALLASLRLRGQQTPIEVVQLATGKYGLISGWRRCQALAQLHAEDGGEDATVLVLLRRPADASEAYLSMVEENEIRVGLSHYERARITLKAVELGVFESEKAALQSLFHAASRAKRSKVKSFLPIVQALDSVLRFPEGLSERVGLSLAQMLEAVADGGATLRARLMLEKPDTAAAEQKIILAVLAEAKKQTLNPGLESSMSENKVVEPAPGLKITTHKDGRLTLSGPALNAELRAALVQWLRNQSETGE